MARSFNTPNPGKMLLSLASAMLMLSAIFCGCGHKSDELPAEIHESGRDNIVEALPVSLDDSLPMFHVYSTIHLLGDTLIVGDPKSTEKRFFAYNLCTNTPIGWFGKVGMGPGELWNFGGEFFDRKSHRIFGRNGGTMELMWLDIDGALQKDEPPTVIGNFDLVKGLLMSPYSINDTTFLGRLYVYDFETYTGSNRLVRFNPETLSSTPLGDNHPLLQESYALVYYPEKNMIFALGDTKDFIQIYDFDGNLKRTIYGSDYTDSPEKNMEYFGWGTVDSKGRVYATYNGRNKLEARHRDLVIYSPEGEYLKTIRFDVTHLWDVVYHEPTNRIYFSCDGEPQFGYINLADYGL